METADPLTHYDWLMALVIINPSFRIMTPDMALRKQSCYDHTTLRD